MDHAVQIPLLIWALLSLVILIFRRHLKWPYRLMLFLMLAGYIAFWHQELLSIYPFSDFDYAAAAKKAVEMAFFSLIWLWPLSLVYFIYMARDRDVEISIAILTIFTALIWGLYWFLR